MAQLGKVGKFATTVFTDDDGTIKIVYHSTTVVSFNNNTIVLRSGGWETVTTRTRMNQASKQFKLGYSVFQEAYEWFVDFKGETVPFRDGIVLTR